MKVGWLADKPSYVGGAELTAQEFRAAAPANVEIVDCPPGEIVDDCDVYAVHNCVTYPVQDLEVLRDRRIRNGTVVFKYWNDVGSWYSEDVRTWLDRYAAAICCSPLQASYMGLEGIAKQRASLIPPSVPLERFEKAAESVNGSRAGAVCVGSWRNIGKGARNVQEWALEHGDVDFYGNGPFAPPNSSGVNYQVMPQLLAQYERFVYLPSVIEPFGRTVAEAWAAGCEIVTNGLVGAAWWLEENPDAIRTAAEDYWKLILG